MYYDYFGLQEAPFSIAPNPNYLFLTERHQEALAHLYYGIKSDAGFVLLTGEVGAGKTTVCRHFLNNLPTKTKIVFILNPLLNPMELLREICQELQIENVPGNASLRQLGNYIYQCLLENHAKGINTILLIDEAQQVSDKVLELIRLLTNFETDKQKLLKIILVGQPELNSILAKPSLKQLSQRITARHHIHPLESHEISTYIAYRLRMAGYRRKVALFPKSIVKRIFSMSGGVPRLINIICDRALLGVYVNNVAKVNGTILHTAFNEAFGEPKNHAFKNRKLIRAGSAALICAVMLGGWYLVPTINPEIRLIATDTLVSDDKTKSNKSTMVAENSEIADNVEFGGEEQLHVYESIDQLDHAYDSVEDEVLPIEGLDKIMDTSQAPVSQINPSSNLLGKLEKANHGPDRPIRFSSREQAVNRLVHILLPKSSEENRNCSDIKLSGWRCDDAVVMNWKGFKYYNRPAVIRLVDSEAVSYYMAVIGMTETHAMVLSEEGTMVMSLIGLGEFWTGELTYLWQAPIGFSSLIYRHSNTSLVRWLASSFAKLDGQKKLLAKRYYNNLLRKRINLFQKSNNLEVDGKAGIQTLLRLNEQVGVAVTLDSFWEASSVVVN